MEFESEDEGRTDVVVVNTQAFGNTGGADLKVVQDDNCIVSRDCLCTSKIV
jgi:hypothetical protein